LVAQVGELVILVVLVVVVSALMEVAAQAVRLLLGKVIKEVV
jgi:hypothetical protein